MNGKKVLITGASSGIGEAIARLFHEYGASVLLSGTREAKLEEIRASLGERAHFHAVPLTEDGASEALMDKAEELMGGCDVLINNAGITRDVLLMRMSDDDWDAVLNTNLRAVMRLSRAAIRPMMRQRAGRIINISSVVAAKRAMPGNATMWPLRQD